MHIVRLQLPTEGMQRTCAILRIHELCGWIARSFNVSARDQPESGDVWRIELRGQPETAWTHIVSELRTRLDDVTLVS